METSVRVDSSTMPHMLNKVYADPSLHGPMVMGRWGDPDTRVRFVVRTDKGGRGGRGRGQAGRGRTVNFCTNKDPCDDLYADLIAVDEKPPFFDKKEFDKFPTRSKTDTRVNYLPVDTHTIALNVLVSHHAEHGRDPLCIDQFLDHLARMQILLRDAGCDVDIKRDQLLKYLDTKPWIRVKYIKNDPKHDCVGISFDPEKRVTE